MKKGEIEKGRRERERREGRKKKEGRERKDRGIKRERRRGMRERPTDRLTD